MRVYSLWEVSNKPRKDDHRYSEVRIYQNDIYMTAEVEVEGSLTGEDEIDISDEEFDKRVQEKVEEIMETLAECGRYPEYGVPQFVAY